MQQLMKQKMMQMKEGMGKGRKKMMRQMMGSGAMMPDGDDKDMDMDDVKMK